MQIALFGTSADPPTPGHQMILHWLSDRFDRVAIWAADNPFKSHQTPLEHRMRMLELAIDDLHLPRQNVHLYPQLSYSRTLHTVAAARRIWGEAALTVVIGADLVAQLPSWHQVEVLLSQVELLVVPRPGYDLEESSLAELRQRGARVTIADVMGWNVSSSAYRERGEMDGLAPAIEAYIHREHLYKCQDESREKQLAR
jgi:nicotinate-nucleotide adenylyltransferase